MFLPLAVLGFVAAFTVPSSFCCRPVEYETRDGQCCPRCQEGSYVKRDCTSLSGTKCDSCGDGTYMDQPNGRTECFRCSTCDQGLGVFIKRNCTTKSDTLCDVLPGFYCTTSSDKTGCSSAEKHSGCQAGQRIKEPGTSRSDTVCEDCPPGTFSTDGVNCTTWTSCSGGQTKTREGSSSSDVVCASASRHHLLPLLPLLLSVVAVVGLVFTGRQKPKHNPAVQSAVE